MTDKIAYPGILRAALEISLDNGGINRSRAEPQMRKELAQFLAHQPSDILPAIDKWLAALSDNDLETVCCGEQSEMAAVMQDAPPFTDKLLNDYFEEVC